MANKTDIDWTKNQLVPINKLKGLNFYIPSYQRGYRWNEQQARELLDDLLAYTIKTQGQKGNKEIYSLQPLVVSESGAPDDKSKTRWRVVDGQQRLTTIFLLLKYLYTIKDDVSRRLKKKWFSIEYERDVKDGNGSKVFLDRITEKKDEEELANVDFYHMYLVFGTIRDWFEKENEKFAKVEGGIKGFVKTLLSENVVFLWDPIESEQENKTFTDLNSGRIPLTDSELIKALFLNRNNFADCADANQLESKRNKLAGEWYEIERTLQNDEFWHFIHKKDYTKPTRIDFVLWLVFWADAATTAEKLLDDHEVFRHFYSRFEERKNIGIDSKWVEGEWKKIKKIFDTLLEWYNDYKLYHYIGYLVAVKTDTTKGERVAERFIGECIKLWQGKKPSFEDKSIKSNTDNSKEEFIAALKKEILYRLKNDKSVKESKQEEMGKCNFLSDLIDAHHKKKGKKLADIKGLQTVGRKKTIIDYLEVMNFDQSDENEKDIIVGYSKRCCVNLLLLHNVETEIRYNDRLVNNNRYTLPYFTRFPFHLYDSEHWQVEHIRPKSGDAIFKETERLSYLLHAITYFTKEGLEKETIKAGDNLYEALKACYGKEWTDAKEEDKCLYRAIQFYINKTDKIEKIDYRTLDLDAAKRDAKDHKEEEIYEHLDKRESESVFDYILNALDEYGGKELPASEKNRIWNFTLLDSGTNQEYGNQIFPFKRAFIAEKERGHKLRNGVVENEDYPRKDDLKYRIDFEVVPEETPFVLKTTKNVFTKYYGNLGQTDDASDKTIGTMLHWTEEDAKAYWKNMQEVLAFYFNALDKELWKKTK